MCAFSQGRAQRRISVPGMPPEDRGGCAVCGELSTFLWVGPLRAAGCGAGPTRGQLRLKLWQTCTYLLQSTRIRMRAGTVVPGSRVREDRARIAAIGALHRRRALPLPRRQNTPPLHGGGVFAPATAPPPSREAVGPPRRWARRRALRWAMGGGVARMGRGVAPRGASRDSGGRRRRGLGGAELRRGPLRRGGAATEREAPREEELRGRGGATRPRRRRRSY